MIPATIPATVRPSAIGGYEDWPAYLKDSRRYAATSVPAQELADVLGVPAVPEAPRISVEWEEAHDGVITSRLQWQLGFGPVTKAWLIRPAGATALLPGVLALHCHAGIKSQGADRLVAVPPPRAQEFLQQASLQQTLYDGRAFASWLASRGFAVLAHDAFAWGSRGFKLDPLPGRTASAVDGRLALWRESGVEPSSAELYDAAAAAHEDTVAKAAGLLGTSFAGMVAHDDLAALNVLAGLPGVDAERLGCLGFSGGGGRSLILAALSPKIRSHVVTCMMATFESLVPSYLDAHSWLLQTPGLSRLGEWPELTARAKADSMLVQYALADELFPEEGMRDADAILKRLHPAGRHVGSFWPGGHTFTRDMQDEAAAFLAAGLKAKPAGLRKKSSLPRVALVGVHGFGARHLDNLERLVAEGRVELVAVADPRPPLEGSLDPAVKVFSTLDELLAAGMGPDVVIIATPIQTHAPLALTAIASGADVYLEKPPVASWAQFEEVLAAADAAGRLVQVGFQSLGSEALPEIAKVIESGDIGEVRGYGAVGAWVRNIGYFKRSRWAGKRSLDGTDVVDGVATNALAHAVATGLCIAGADTAEQIATVEADLYRAHDTESDDTSTIRVRTSNGQVLICALTLCAAAQSPPSVTVFGTRGKAEFFYTEDRLVLETANGVSTRTFGRMDLLENLLAARSTGDPGLLLSSLSSAGSYMRVLEAIRTAESPQEIRAEHVRWEGEGDDAHPVVLGVEDLLKRSILAQSTFSELGAPWAVRVQPIEGAAGLELEDRIVAHGQDGGRIMPTSSPRPYLHPISTLAGIVVTDHLPEDHVWHLGAGVAIQDVAGVNFWGGRTYTRDAGAYVWRNDHGRVHGIAKAMSPGSLSEALGWIGPDGSPILNEQRQWSAVALGPSTWNLRLDFKLSPAGSEPVSLGSPGSNGRDGGGYGGFFWRLPHVRDARVWTADAEGEDCVHGTIAPWLAWSGYFEALPAVPAGTAAAATAGGAGAASIGGAAPATLVFLASPQAPDPWFVRQSGYPGVGLSLAWDKPLLASRSNPVRRTIDVLIADGILTTEDIEQLIESLGESA